MPPALDPLDDGEERFDAAEVDDDVGRERDEVARELVVLGRASPPGR